MFKISPTDERLWSSREAADQVGVSLSKFHRLVDAGRITPRQQLSGLRGAFLFDSSAVAGLAEELRSERLAEIARLEAALVPSSPLAVASPGVDGTSGRAPASAAPASGGADRGSAVLSP